MVQNVTPNEAQFSIAQCTANLSIARPNSVFIFDSYTIGFNYKLLLFKYFKRGCGTNETAIP